MSATSTKGKYKPVKRPESCRDPVTDPHDGPDWSGKCEVCGASPVVVETGMCGPCTFGEADTAGGNW